MDIAGSDAADGRDGRVTEVVDATTTGYKPGEGPTTLAWLPGGPSAGHLPAGHRLEMNCRMLPGGGRRLSPATGAETFVVAAALGGWALARGTRDRPTQADFGHHSMRLIYQHAPRLREHNGRTFSHRADLALDAASGGGDVLPRDLGWGVDDLIRVGRGHAVAAGTPSPTEADCIARGLYLGARRRPLDPASLGDGEGLALVRLALFAPGPGTGPIEPDAAALVEERLLGAVRRHVADEGPAFRRWFYDGRDGVILGIAKRKGAGGPIDREVVRGALLDLVFRAHGWVGRCVEAQMRAFAATMPGPLDPAERASFDTLYRGQPHLGGLPLILLWRLFPTLRHGVLGILDAPGDARAVASLLRQLADYQEMSEARRAADRERKRRAPGRNRAGRAPTTIALPAEHAAPGGGRVTEDIEHVYDRLRAARGLDCPCGGREDWRASLAPEADAGHGRATIDYLCLRCGSEGHLSADIPEIRRLALADDPRPARPAPPTAGPDGPGRRAGP